MPCPTWLSECLNKKLVPILIEVDPKAVRTNRARLDEVTPQEPEVGKLCDCPKVAQPRLARELRRRDLARGPYGRSFDGRTGRLSKRGREDPGRCEPGRENREHKHSVSPGPSLRHWLILMHYGGINANETEVFRSLGTGSN